MTDIAIAIAGCTGRMGRALVDAVLAQEDAALTAATARPGTPAAGHPLRDGRGADTGVVVSDDPNALFAADVVIDFTEPESTAVHAQLAARTGTALVIGTTGLSRAQQEAIYAAGRQTPICQAANFSLGVNLLKALVARAAAALPESFDIEILEMHHRHKVDAPSGTALALGEAAAAARGADFEAVARRTRDGQVGPRPAGEIGFATLRGGDVAGEHAAIFAGPEERLELSHKAASRAIFARGAVTAAFWLADKSAGLYSMDDVLGLA